MSRRCQISLQDVTKHYLRGQEEVRVLEHVDFEIPAGEFLALTGPSGSGKTTLLNLLAGLDHPTSGRVIVDGVEISDLDEASLARWRNGHVGFVFQFYDLVPVLTAFENVELPLLLLKLPRRVRKRQVAAVLELVGLGHRLHHRPGQLSGGEQQRVGIARAIVANPNLIVADEPTGDLDWASSEGVLDLLQALHEQMRKTIIIVTHDPRAAARARVAVRLSRGRLIVDDPAARDASLPDTLRLAAH
jgi:putative ABC transport system ATP-binding protein